MQRRPYGPLAASLVIGASLSLGSAARAAHTDDAPSTELRLESFARSISVTPSTPGLATTSTDAVSASPASAVPLRRGATRTVAAAPPAWADRDRSELAGLGERLDALQRRNDTQEAEIARLRSQIGGIANASGRAAPQAVALAAVPPSVPGDGTVATPGAGTGASTQSSGTGPNAPQPRQVAIVNEATTTQQVTKPADRSVESVYEQHNALFRRNLTLTPSITRAYSDNRFVTLNGFLALGAIFLGNVNVTQQRTDLTIAALNATYGLSNRFQLDGTLPYFNRSTNFSSVGANNSSSQPSEDNVANSGIGDAVVGAFYQLRPESNTSPGITLNGHVSIPTGRSPYGIKLVNDPLNDNLQYPGRLPTGSGVPGVQIGASFVKTSDPVVWFGGANYYYNLPKHFADLSNDRNTVVPGFARPGNTFQYQLGTAFALNERTSLSFAFSDSISNEILVKPDGGPITPVIGSATNAAMLSISTGFASNPHQTVVTEFDLGLTKDAPNFQLDMRFPHRF